MWILISNAFVPWREEADPDDGPTDLRVRLGFGQARSC
jgi:hypothetical protein